MELEEALEQPDDCSQDSPMKVLKTELNSLKRHFPTVKSINGECPSNAVASVVNTIKAVSAACQAKAVDQHMRNIINDSSCGCQDVSESPDEDDITSKLYGDKQISKVKSEPEIKRAKLSNEDCENKKSRIETDKIQENGSTESIKDKNNTVLVTDSKTFEENEFKTCSSEQDCSCGEETEFKLQIEATPEKCDDIQDSELDDKHRKPLEDYHTPIKNHQCPSEEARTSPFFIRDQMRNSLKGIVEKVKSSPDHRRNLCSYQDGKDNRLIEPDKSHYNNDKLIAQVPDSPESQSKIEKSAAEACDDENDNPSSIPKMAHVQSENIASDNVKDQNNHIPTDSVRLKKNASELMGKSPDDQELLLGVDDDTHMDISSDKEDELLQDSLSDNELNNESVVYLGEEINGHDKTNDLKSKNSHSDHKDNSMVSGNPETDFRRVGRTSTLDSSSSSILGSNSQGISNSDEHKKQRDDSILFETEPNACDSDSQDCSNDLNKKIEISTKNMKVVNEGDDDAENSSVSNSEKSNNEPSVEGAVTEETENHNSAEEDDVIFEGIDGPNVDQNVETKIDNSKEDNVSKGQKSADVDKNAYILSGIVQNNTETKTEKKATPSLDSDISLIEYTECISEKNVSGKSSSRTTNDIGSSSHADSDQVDGTEICAALMSETVRNGIEMSGKEDIAKQADCNDTTSEAKGMDENDDEDDDVIFEGVVKSATSGTGKSSKDSEVSNVSENQSNNAGSKTCEKVTGLSESVNQSGDKENEVGIKSDKSAMDPNRTVSELRMCVDEADDDDDVIFEGVDKPNNAASDHNKNKLNENIVSRDELDPQTVEDCCRSERIEDKAVSKNKDEKPSGASVDTDNDDQKLEAKASLKRPADSNSELSSNPKRTRLDEVIGKLGSQIGVEPESIEVSESDDDDEEEESATDTAVEKSEDTTTSDNEDDETASDSEKVKYVKVTEKELEELIQERVAACLASQRETLIGQLSQKIQDLQVSNDQWRAQVKELQAKVTDVTVLNLKHEKRKAATAALKQITTRSVSVQVGEGKTASASKQSTPKSEPPANVAKTPPHKPLAKQKSPTPLVTAQPGSNGTIRLPIPQSSITPPVLAAQMPQLPQPAAVLGTANYQTPTVKSLLDTTRQQITSGSLTKTSPATSSVQYPQRNIPQNKTGYVSVPQPTSSLVVSTIVTVPTKNMTPSAQASSTTGPTTLKVIDLTLDEGDNRQQKMLTLPAAQMQTLNQLRPVIQSPQQQFILNQNGQLIQTSPVVSGGQTAFQLVFNSTASPIRASIPQSGTVVQAVPQQNVTTLNSQGSVGTQQLVTQVPGQGILSGQAILRTPPTSSQITSLLSQTKTTVAVPTVHVHPAPLPAMPANQQLAGFKLLPPKPSLKISRVSQGIVLSWNMTLNDSYAEIASYQLFAYQEGSSQPSTALWKKVGDVKALPLPMACTLTQFQVGNKYHFAVRAVDVNSRVGQFSDYSSIHLTPVATVTGKS